MFKFSQLVAKACEPINLTEILKVQYLSRGKVFRPDESQLKTRKSIKFKSNGRKKSSSSNATDSRLLSPVKMQKYSFKSSSSATSNLPLATNDPSATNTPSAASKPEIRRGKGNRPFEKLTRRVYAEDALDDSGITFTFMSYNILAQDLLETHPYLYEKHRREHLSWTYRLARLSADILAVRPEILCLQEVQEDHIPAILKSVETLDFAYIFKKKTGEKTDGCAILYNRKLFGELERHSVEYFQPNIKYLDRENVAIIAKFFVKSNPSSCFIASTTHLLYNPRRQDVRLAQIQLLLAELDRVAFNGFHKNGVVVRLPIILAGDFNLQPKSAPYKLITSGNLAYQRLTKRTLEESTSNDETELIGNEYLPPCLGITDFCQHYDMVKNNYRGHTRIQNTDIHKLLHPDIANCPIDNNHRRLFSSGALKHDLKLSSVYDHQRREGTTFQNKWITVDYLFYSKHFSPKSNSICEGYLKLLSRYMLPSYEQCISIGLIPNSSYGSDHLSLAAQFFLESPK